MHAFLLINNDSIQFAKKLNAKVIPFELQKIDDVRNLKKLTKFSFNEKTAIVINDIDLATNEALNAFLKNLEEPNKNLIYLLSASNLENVLPTIVSRCEIIKSPNKRAPVINQDLEIFLKQTKSQQIDFVGKIKERSEALKFIEEFVFFEHQNNRHQNIENCLETIKNLRANGNVSLQLANFVVMLNR